MKLLGVIGGLGPESTIEYYRELFRQYRERVSDGSAPPLLVNSLDLKRVVGCVAAGDLAALADYLSAEVKRLADAGAQLAIISANMPHLAFDEVQRRSPIPMLSIVETACAAAKSKGLRRLGLLGAGPTMKARLYPDVFGREQMEIVVPTPAEQDFVHDIYFNQLVKGIVLNETRERLLQIALRMKNDDGVEGLLLGGTELSLIIKDLDGTGLEMLDTMKIQVAKAIDQILA